jgi:hypothetical protein
MASLVSNSDGVSEEKVEPMHVDIRNLTFGYPGNYTIQYNEYINIV